MGKFLCGSHVSVEFDDRVLAHLQLVISAKLRRQESTMFTWRDDPESGDGRTAVWLHPAADLTFKYHGSRKPAINPEWVEALMAEANRPGGLQIVEEPATDESAPRGHQSVLH